MKIVSIKFKIHSSEKFTGGNEIDFEEMTDLLRALVDNGQLIEFFSHPKRINEFVEFRATCLDPKSLSDKYFNSSIVKRLDNLRASSIEFEYDVEMNDSENYEAGVAEEQNFILYFGGGSPVRSIDTFFEVPLYLFPKTSADGTNYFNIITWGRNYDSIYRLWFRGEIDESYFYNQLSNLKSDLSEQGLHICKQLQTLTTKTFYYYLFRYPETPSYAGDNCPNCGRPWKLSEKFLDTFEYKCSYCFLLS